MAKWSFPAIAHGADYYPEQWLSYPGIIEKDIKYMKEAKINIVTMGVFAWVMEEPEEGRYEFDWLEGIIEKLHHEGISVMLATPSGARPAWLDRKYPEVLRVTEGRQRNLHGMRMNHCYTSPKYRELVFEIDSALAKRFAHHPAVVGWHVSNEYHGECHCPLCQAAFRTFLQKKYHSLDSLNDAWWSTFWSKKYTAWDQIESPSSRGEKALSALELDWKRFVTAQTKSFMEMEISAIRPYNRDLPVTTNMIGSFPEIDYPKFKDVLDVAGLDVYPQWGRDDSVADEAGFQNDITRCLLDKPYLLMETTPSMTNWEAVCQPKRPGVHMFSSIQALAHGADSFMMFQWRQGLGGYEKFHGAVIGHDGKADTRVFREVKEVGERLERLSEIRGSVTDAKVALVFDWNNRWAVKASKGPREGIDPDRIAFEYYSVLAAMGFDVDVIDSEHTFDGYRLVVAPILYMVKQGVSERLRQFVWDGGTFLATCFSGVVDENDRCFFGGAPGPLEDLLGIKSEELFTLYPWQKNSIVSPTFLTSDCDFWCDVIRIDHADAVATYARDYFKGGAAITCNRYGEGTAWYVGTHIQASLIKEIFLKLVSLARIKPNLASMPEGVRVHERKKNGRTYLFCLNSNPEPVTVNLPESVGVDNRKEYSGVTELEGYECLVLRLHEK